ncbi:MAG: MTH938/NDUFAF3 family protein [Gammaproteobacteria bacterium]|nr:MTH938/NDUFAF3 family protein [Gammaproteobacteria bacterium]MDH3578462.1 MTH938/NDUFAF3 family protein [Gammaproteobacteria bacterium]
MKFTRDLNRTLTIQSVSELAITINGEPYARTIAVTPDEVFENWDPKPVADLDDSDFDILLQGAPEIILLGTGRSNVFPPRKLMFAFARLGVGLECMDTAAAARTFNVLAAEGRQVAAVLYL